MVVLKGVPALLSPELLYALARMGHGDEIVLADVNFPTSSICRCGPEEIRADGLGIPQLLEAMLRLLPLDTYVENPAVVMELVPSDRERGLQTPVWKNYQSILSGAHGMERTPGAPVLDSGPPGQLGGTQGPRRAATTAYPHVPACSVIEGQRPSVLGNLGRVPGPSHFSFQTSLAKIERFEFYQRAKKAFAVVATGETALYGNLILKKGVLAPCDLV
ncbi:hypothetical protein MC885_010010 [Smutsia gigantea]|nr:hypothetical protein MC885_010010 [Smutsia gigantea]